MTLESRFSSPHLIVVYGDGALMRDVKRWRW